MQSCVNKLDVLSGKSVQCLILQLFRIYQFLGSESITRASNVFVHFRGRIEFFTSETNQPLFINFVRTMIHLTERGGKVSVTFDRGVDRNID